MFLWFPNMNISQSLQINISVIYDTGPSFLSQSLTFDLFWGEFDENFEMTITSVI